MLCSKCSKEVPPGFAVCPFCSQRILSGDPLTAAATPAPQKTPSLAFNLIASLGAVVSIILIIFLSFASTRRNYGSLTSEASGYFVGRIIGAFLFPAIGVLLYKKFGKQEHSAVGLFAACCTLAFGFSFLGAMGDFARPGKFSGVDPRQRIAALAKEGMGQAPSTGNQEEFDGIIRPFFADIKKFNEDYIAEVNQLEARSPGILYSARSFDGEKSISGELEYLRATEALEDKYASMDFLLQKTKTRLSALDISEKDKDAFWNGFEGSFKKSVEPRDRLNATERVWLNDSIALYEFMEANQKVFHVKNGKIVFFSDAPLKEYNERIDKVERERKEFLEAKEKFTSGQKAELGKIGLKPSDFAASEHK